MTATTKNVGLAKDSVTESAPSVDATQLSIVVVGNGPVGFRFVQSLVERQMHGECSITVFGEEPRPAYDRVNLTKFLDDASPDVLQYEPRSWYESNSIELHTGDPVVSIDRDEKVVRSRSGKTVPYDQLVMATGSSAFMPPIPGIDHTGVFPYRTIEDLSQIRDYAADCKRAVVLGGGLLGLEAADALTKLGVNVFVVEMAPVLMPRQLDSAGASLLRRLIESPRIKVLVQRQTQKISEIEEGLHVQFSNGESIVADMVVVSAGIRARDELARDCELPVGKRGGIVVNDQLQTEDPSIFAIGECAEHAGTVYGLVAPGFRMANVLAERVRGEDAEFLGSNESTRLKLVGINVVFCGDYLDTTRAQTPAWESPDGYTKLIIRKNRLVGMIGVGKVPQLERLQEAIDQERRVFWWNHRRFQTEGRLWSDQETVDVASWPPQIVVCSCNGVTRGCLTVAMENGCTSVEALAAETKATTTCGSCTSLVQQFVGLQSSEPNEAERNQLAVAGVSAISLVLLALLVLATPITLPDSVRTAATVWQTLISDFFWKQVTGYTLTALTALSLVISVRKRTRFLQKFQFSSLRLLHVCLASAALAVLIAHTGFHRGSNLNFGLFGCFVLASMSGVVVGILSGMESRLPPRLRILRRPATLWHILCLWPLPLLVAFHIVSVYWL